MFLPSQYLSRRKVMHTAFIQSEKALQEHIENILNKINSSKKSIPAMHILDVETIKILTNAKTKIQEIDAKYAALSSKRKIDELTQIWNALTSAQNTFSAEVDVVYQKIMQIASKIPARNNRSASIQELIATIAAERDQGRSQAAVLAKIQSNVITNAAMAIFQLSQEDHDNDDIRRACVERALSTEAAALREVGDEHVIAMWANQEAAVNEFISEFLSIESKCRSLSALQRDVCHQWELFERITAEFDESEEDDRLSSLATIIEDTVSALSNVQRKMKASVNHFGLTELINEIQFGQKNYFEAFHAQQLKLEEILMRIYDFASLTPPDSPSSPRTQSQSSFFSESSDEEIPRKRKRQRSSDEETDETSDVDSCSLSSS